MLCTIIRNDTLGLLDALHTLWPIHAICPFGSLGKIIDALARQKKIRRWQGAGEKLSQDATDQISSQRTATSTSTVFAISYGTSCITSHAI